MRGFFPTVFICLSFLSSVSIVKAQAARGVDVYMTVIGGAKTGGSTVTGGAKTAKDITLVNPLGTTDLMTLLGKILDFVIYLGSIVVILMLVYVGFLFVTARGEPGKLTTARQALLWTVLGALILLGSKAIALGIEATAKALTVGK